MDEQSQQILPKSVYKSYVSKTGLGTGVQSRRLSAAIDEQYRKERSNLVCRVYGKKVYNESCYSTQESPLLAGSKVVGKISDHSHVKSDQL